MRRAAVLLALSCWLAVPLPARADDAAPPPVAAPGPSLPSFPSASDIAGALVVPFERALGEWFATIPLTIAGWVTTFATSLIDTLAGALADLFTQLNLITTLPPGLSYNLPAVQQLRGKITAIAATLWLLAAACVVGTAAGGTMLGRSWTALWPGIGRLLLAGAAVKLAPAAMAGWIDLCNSLSLSLLNLDTGLPGLAALDTVGRTFAELAAAGLYVIVAALLLLGRVGTLVWVDLLLVVAPLALVAWALPFPLAQRFGTFWLNQFVLSTFVQVLLAVVLALAAGILGAFGSASAGGVSQWVASAVLAAGLCWTAFRLPGRLNGLAAGQGALPVQVVQRAARWGALKLMAAAAL